MRARTGARKTRRQRRQRRQRQRSDNQRGGAAIELMMTQFVAGATRIAPVAFAMGYKMYKNRSRKTRRVKSRSK
jgi:hypothetical protein